MWKLKTVCRANGEFVQYLQIFGAAASCSKTVLCFNITPTSLQVGSSFLPRRTLSSVTRSSRRTRRPLHCQLRPLASLITCIRMNWMCILVSIDVKMHHTLTFCISFGLDVVILLRLVLHVVGRRARCW